MLSQLQAHLTRIYRVDPGYDVSDFLITDPLLAKTLAGNSMIPGTDESVLVQEDEDGLALSVFLDSDLLERLNANNPMSGLRADQLADLWTVLEGISHFNYIAWSARKNRKISLLELEMQAEIDKFVSALFLALHQEHTGLAGNIHRWLFDEISFNPQLSQDQQERYVTANQYAARFCHGLHERLTKDRDLELRELRQFYRLSQREKISHIHSQSFAH
jgi:hypothetical protein